MHNPIIRSIADTSWLARGYETLVEFSSIYLLKVRREALRKRVWFKVLNVTERAILSLAPKCVNQPRSVRLIGILASIIVKINDALKSQVTVLTSQVGLPLAKRLSWIAVNWGHKTAWKWASDSSFSRHLAVVQMNDEASFRGSRSLMMDRSV